MSPDFSTLLYPDRSRPAFEFMASRDTPLHWCHAWELIARVVIVDHCFQLSMKNLLNPVFVAWQYESYTFNLEAVGYSCRVDPEAYEPDVKIPTS
jgi:hypothetical protein